MTGPELIIEEIKSNLVDMTSLKDFYRREYEKDELQIDELKQEIEHLKNVIDAKQGTINHLIKAGTK